MKLVKAKYETDAAKYADNELSFTDDNSVVQYCKTSYDAALAQYNEAKVQYDRN